MAEEAGRAETHYVPREEKNAIHLYEMPFKQAYLEANANLAPAHTQAELKRRADAARFLMKNTFRPHGSGGSMPHAPLPAHAVGLGSLTGIEDFARENARREAPKRPPSEPRGPNYIDNMAASGM